MYNQKIISCILGFITSTTILSNPVISTEYHNKQKLGGFFELISAQFNGKDPIMLAFIFILLTYMYYKLFRMIGKPKCTTIILAVLYAVFFVIGKSYATYNDLSYMVSNFYQIILSLWYLCGYILFFYLVLEYIVIFSKKSNIDYSRQNKLKRKNLFIFFILCWLPYILIFYPGSVPHDGYYQLNQFYGIDLPTNHHPWFSTLVLGGGTWIGKHISDNFGIFFFILMQSVLCAFVFTIICRKISEYHIPNIVKNISILYFGILPAWGGYAQALIKDTIYYALFALFMVFYIEIIEQRNLLNKKMMINFFIIISLIILYRKEAIYIVLLSLLCLLLIIPSSKYITIILTLCSVLFIYAGYKMIVLPAFEVKEGSRREALSIPFQQTARYVIKHQNDITEEEIILIDQILSYEKLKEIYEPTLSDPVKSTFKNPSKDILYEYFKLWLKQFIKDPGCYIEAALNQCFGYFYPEYQSTLYGTMQFYIKGEPVATGDLNIYYIFPDNIRNIFDIYLNFWMKIPILSLLMYPGTYTWILLFIMMILTQNKKWPDLVACLPMLLIIINCMLSPVNGLLRYSLPVMASMPLLLAFCLNTTADKTAYF